LTSRASVNGSTCNSWAGDVAEDRVAMPLRPVVDRQVSSPAVAGVPATPNYPPIPAWPALTRCPQ
jgi:hypothetical protein